MRAKYFLIALFTFGNLLILDKVIMISHNAKIPLINTMAIVQSGAIVNETNNYNNFNIIIIGMVIIIVLLVGFSMFGTKK